MDTVWWILVAAGGATGLLAAVGVRYMMRPGPTPAEREKKRRRSVSARGRTTVATITDFHEGVLSYTYEIRGVEYAATQDVSELLGLVEDDPAALVARPAGIKYLPQNPANSIVLCEDWSGLKFGPKAEGSRRRPVRSSPAS
jgi:hypothetical protein